MKRNTLIIIKIIIILILNNRCFGRILFILTNATPSDFDVDSSDKVSKIRPAKEFRPLKNLLREYE